MDIINDFSFDDLRLSLDLRVGEGSLSRHGSGEEVEHKAPKELQVQQQQQQRTKHGGAMSDVSHTTVRPVVFVDTGSGSPRARGGGGGAGLRVGVGLGYWIYMQCMLRIVIVGRFFLFYSIQFFSFFLLFFFFL